MLYALGVYLKDLVPGATLSPDALRALSADTSSALNCILRLLYHYGMEGERIWQQEVQSRVPPIADQFTQAAVRFLRSGVLC